MKFNTNKTKLQFTSNGTFVFYCEVPQNQADELNKLCNKDVLKSIEIKQYREKRSLSANAYAWTILNKIAVIMGSTDEEIYEDMLHKYGTHEYIACMPDIISELKKTVKLVEIKGESIINGKKAITVKLIRGSSTYDSREMSRFIEGVVSEAKLLNIETMTPDELERMIGESYEKQLLHV